MCIVLRILPAIPPQGRGAGMLTKRRDSVAPTRLILLNIHKAKPWRAPAHTPASHPTASTCLMSSIRSSVACFYFSPCAPRAPCWSYGPAGDPAVGARVGPCRPAQRTIGVITTPGMVPEGQSSMHRKIIERVSSMPPHASSPYRYHARVAAPMPACNQRASRSRPAPAAADTAANTSSPSSGGSLRLGCYVVKNPSQEAVDAGITFAHAREEELKYFQSSPHWGPAVATSTLVASRIGADNLRDGLSALLVSQIQQHLPDIRARVREWLAAV